MSRMNQINSARVFISSTGQESLVELRRIVADRLSGAGHLPLLFEHNFGLWTNDLLRDCLAKVDESDVFILFISNKCGSYTQVDPNKTVTYAEYYRARKGKKIIIPFIEEHIFKFFLNHIAPQLRHQINSYVKEYDRYPDSTYTILKDWFQQLEVSNPVLFEQIKETRVDLFNWAFIYDVYVNEPWTYNVKLANVEKACEFVLESLSEVIRKVSPFFQDLDAIQELLANGDQMRESLRAANRFHACLKDGGLDTLELLEVLRGYMKGRDVPHSNSPLDEDIVNRLSDCEAICLYKRDQDYLRLLECVGDSDPTYEFMINDENSYVAETYRQNNDSVENIFYNEEKKKLYLTKKLGDLVISLHYRLLKEDWSEKRVQSYEKQLLTAIMKERRQFDFAADILGGLLNGKK